MNTKKTKYMYSSDQLLTIIHIQFLSESKHLLTSMHFAFKRFGFDLCIKALNSLINEYKIRSEFERHNKTCFETIRTTFKKLDNLVIHSNANLSN